ncbi:MAG: Gfo/Idh/MocA family oxidoreductase [bacterium]
MNPDRSLRVALIGYGLGGATFHAPLISATAGLELAAIVTKDPTRRAQAQRDFPAARLLDGVADVWSAAASYDLAVVASPSGAHASLALRALEAGLNVVVDKPFAATADEARRIAAAAHARGLLVSPFQNRRWDGDFLTVRRLQADGRLGTVYRFESRFERWRAAAKPRWTEPDAEGALEGIVYDIGSHLVDQALVLFGPVRDVYAESDRRHPAVCVEDEAMIALTHTSGVRSHLFMSAVAGQSGPRMSVYGSRATYVKFGLDPQEDSLKRGVRPGDEAWGEESADRWGTLHDGTTGAPIATEAGAYENFYTGIERALRTRGAPPVDPNDAVESLVVIEAAKRSARERRVVRCDELG